VELKIIKKTCVRLRYLTAEMGSNSQVQFTQIHTFHKVLRDGSQTVHIIN
jgi:hypothetical protein